jgi:hypothetical protein
MELNDESFKKIITSARKRLGKPRSYTGNFQPQQQEGEVCPTHGVVHKDGVSHAKQSTQILGRSGS